MHRSGKPPHTGAIAANRPTCRGSEARPHLVRVRVRVRVGVRVGVGVGVRVRVRVRARGQG